ncbi:glycerol-3-phosphate acyltransferase 3-like, partial [Acipenser oxyrinchus oxyrinchus]
SKTAEMEDFGNIVCSAFIVWLTLVVGLIVLPAMFGISLGITEVYMKVLVKTLEVLSVMLSCQIKDKGSLFFFVEGIILRDDGSMEKEITDLRKGRSKPQINGEFELSDIFYFSKKGFESIVEDEVTHRFTSEELVSWNLLTRSNNNFQYISLRISIIWVLGVCIRYCILLPLR